MPQISKYPLNDTFKELLFEQFWSLIVGIKNPKTAANVFSDLFTSTERLMFAKRLAVAILLVRGKSPTEIRSSLKISFTTIGSVASWTQNVDNPTRKVLLRMAKQKGWEEILDKIEDWIDRMPPLPKTDWKEAGKKKYQRRKVRAAKEALR